MIDAIFINKYGSADHLQFQAVSHTPISTKKIRIAVHYSGINFADIVMRLGLYKDAPPKPFVPGYEISGIVVEIADDVEDFKVGDAVLAGTRFGGYCSEVVVEDWQAIKIPDYLNMEQAAAIPVNFFTAYLALFEFGRIRANDKILIDCATGGVGTLAMQMARAANCSVVGLTSSKHKKSFIEESGGIAYTWQEFACSEEVHFDFILNSSGGKSLKDHYQRLAKSGKLTCIGIQSAMSPGGKNIFQVLKTLWQTPRFHMLKLTMDSKMVSGFNALDFFDDQKWVSKIFQQITLYQPKAHIGGIFPAKEVAKAHKALENRELTGKALLSWR